MKKLLFVMTLMVVTVLSSQAQDKDKGRPNMTPEKIAERMTEKMAEHLNLDEEQKKAVYELNLESTKKRMEAMEKGKEHRDAMREDMEKNRAEHQEKLTKILSPEQVLKWKEAQEERKQRMGDRRRGGPGRGGQK